MIMRDHTSHRPPAKKLAQLGWKTVPHPRYSSDLALSDYHLFRPLKHFLRGKTFVNYDDLKTGVTDFFASQLLEFWTKGIESSRADGGRSLLVMVIILKISGDYE